MKTKILIFTVFLSTQGINAQVFNKNSNWAVITTNIFDETFYDISNYSINGDTLIENVVYSKILKNGNFYSALRETDDNKIYTYFSDLEKELLIYDFNWYPNKTLYCQTSYENSVVQAVLGSEIDSIRLLDGKYYKCIYDNVGKVSLIRGLGDIRGFFISTFELPTNGYQFALLYFYTDSLLIYCNPDYNYCNTNSITVNTRENSKIKVYPNPSDGNIIIEFQDGLYIETLEIFDTKGSLIKTYNVNGNKKVEISLSKGIYMYSTTSKKIQNLSGKIIIK
jgi:hypothetical protein